MKLPIPKPDDKFCVRCGRDCDSAVHCNHIHRCLGGLIRKTIR